MLKPGLILLYADVLNKISNGKKVTHKTVETDGKPQNKMEYERNKLPRRNLYVIIKWGKNGTHKQWK
jgi:hypothetical protein